jgi:hypothetical protein
MKTRDILKGMLLLTGAILSFAACNKDDDGPTLDFNITVPDAWNYFILNSDNVVYYASSPLESASDSISEDVLVTKDDIKGYNLNQFCEAVIASYDNDTSFHQLYFSPEDSTINGAACRKLIHLQTLYTPVSQSNDSIALDAKLTKYFFVRNNYGYVVGMNAMVESYPLYKPVFDTIISSFEFKN